VLFGATIVTDVSIAFVLLIVSSQELLLVTVAPSLNSAVIETAFVLFSVITTLLTIAGLKPVVEPGLLTEMFSRVRVSYSPLRYTVGLEPLSV